MRPIRPGRRPQNVVITIVVVTEGSDATVAAAATATVHRNWSHPVVVMKAGG